MSGFKVGDVVIGQHFVYWPERNGQEGVIKRGPEMVTARDERRGETLTAVQYSVHWSCGAISWVLPSNLRLKRPPSEDQHRDDLTPVKWSDCVWRPSGVSA